MRVIRLEPSHTAEYRAIMLEAYADEPDAFTSTVSEREVLPMKWWGARLSDEPNPDQQVFGAYDGSRLVGVAGLRMHRRKRTKHKALLFGMYVLPEFRGRGIGRALVEAVLEQARSTPDVEVVQLTVTQPNAPALRLYESCGFRPFGTEPLANKIGERYVSVVHMWCPVLPDPV